MPVARPQNTKGKPRKGLRVHCKYDGLSQRVIHRNGLLSFLRRRGSRRVRQYRKLAAGNVTCSLFSEAIYCSRVLNQLGEPISVLAIAPASARVRRRKYQTITGRVYLNCCFRVRRVACGKSWKHDLANKLAMPKVRLGVDGHLLGGRARKMCFGVAEWTGGD
jgi:hypothetical protein